VDISNIIEKLTPVLKSRKAVVGAYLFGSILGRCRPDSDIDVGLLLAPDVSYSEKEVEKILEEILDVLPPLNNHPFDLIILNHSSAIFAYKVITQGRLIYASDLEAVTDFMEKVSRQRTENYPRYRQALEAIVKG
jgi:predicted nucleotidyltransferase